jgi:MFS family permease
MTKAMLTPLVPLYSLELGASVSLVGLLVAASFVLPLFLALPVGSLVDRRGSAPVMTAGAVLMGLAPLIIAVVPGLAAVAVAQVVAGLAHLLMGLATQSFVGSISTGVRRERDYGWYTTFASAGQLAGPLAAGLLADALGYAAAFSAAAAISVVGVVLTRLLPDDRGRASGSAGLGSSLLTVGTLLGRPGVRLGILASASGIFAMTAFSAFQPTYLESLSYSATTIGMLLSLKSLASMAVRPFMPGVTKLLGGKLNTLWAMMLLVAVTLGATGYFESLGPLVLLSIGFGVGFGISQPVSMVTVVEESEPGNRGFLLGLRLTGNRVAQLVGPLVIGLVADALGFGPAFLAGALVVVVGSFLLLLFRPRAAQALNR